MISLGIDIGVTGAIAALDHHGWAHVQDLPTQAIQGKRLVKRRIDTRGLMGLVRQIVKPGDSCIAVIEDLHMRPGNGAAGTASLMHSRGIVEAVLEIARIDVKVISPREWKSELGLIKASKRQSIERAIAEFPALAGDLRRQKDHNRAEALLLALVCMRRFA